MREKRPIFPWVTLAIVAINAYVFAHETVAMRAGTIGYIFDDFHFKWAQFMADPLDQFPTLVTYAFLHGSLDHIIGNMVFFLLFAPPVERRLGHRGFLLAYLFWAVCGGLAHGYFQPFSVGVVGASGAVSGAAGAFLVLFPLWPPFGFLGNWGGGMFSKIPSFFLVVLHILPDIERGLLTIMPLSAPYATAGVAHWCHLGGFLAGAVSVLPVIWRRSE